MNGRYLTEKPAVALEEVPDAPSPTGQYPDEVWAAVDYGPLAETTGMDGDGEEVPDAPSPTGQYPDEVWATVDYSPLAETAGMDGEEVPDAPSPTGQYPDEVWATATVDAGPPAQAASGGAPGEMPEASASEAVPVRQSIPLDVPDIYRIVRAVAAVETGDQPYRALSVEDAARHGLRFGLMHFGQARGDLGKLLTLMQRRDPALFAFGFGDDAEALLRTTNAATAAERLAPVGGHLLWDEHWLEHFRVVRDQPAFQAAQNEMAIEHQFRPLVPVAAGLGFHSDRGLAMVYERAVALGAGEGLAWVATVAGPLQTPEQLAEGLRLLGHSSLSEFQASTGLPPSDGVLTPETHAALARRLRERNAMPLPGEEEMMAWLLAAADITAQARLRQVQASPLLDGSVFDL